MLSDPPNPQPPAPSPFILLAIGYYADDPRKPEIFKRCLDSARISGAHMIEVFATGENRPPPSEFGWVRVGDLKSHQQGEAAIVEAMTGYAFQMNADWLVKVAGDTFHAAPGWARALVDLAYSLQPAACSLIATEHHVPDRYNTQVFAARPAFLVRTWPRRQDPRLLEIGIEATWGERILRMGLKPRVHVPPSRMIAADEWVNFSPAAPELAYEHTHRPEVARAWRIAAAPDPDPELAVSVVIPARNETGLNTKGESLFARTLQSIWETSGMAGLPYPEIVVVDDGSDQPLPVPPLPDGAPFRYIRNPIPLGVDPSRNIGAAAASGDVVGVLDAHMECQTQTGKPIPGAIQTLARVASDRCAIAVGRCAHLELSHLDDVNYPHCGANFVPITAANHGPSCGWHHVHPTVGIHRITGLLGASYFFPREIWRDLEGFVDCCRGWGFSEEGMGMKAAFLGIPIYCAVEITVSHWFRSSGPFPFPLDGFEKWMNCARVCRVAWEEEAFQNFWLPRIKSWTMHWTWGERHDRTINEEHVIREACRFRAKKRKTDAEVMAELFKCDMQGKVLP